MMRGPCGSRETGGAPAPLSRRRPGTRALDAAFLALLAAACSHYKPTPLYPLAPTAPDARTITVTLDQCECDECRVAIANPTTHINVFNMRGLPVGQEMTATTCYVETSLDAILECGICPGPATCSAQLTVKAKGDAGEVTLSPVVACTTPTGTGGQCQAQQQNIDVTIAPTTNCSS